ncbi:reverse transcriptase domain-containing protein [Tanacetum coccineum]|uniref:Reverse transcriptase domain-containing protein n=1 Tax=Tanacetum coccineum TaxID=301880 RepID=A0ABQ5GT66_9ASTR
MTTPVEKRNASKFCEFHGEVGHNTDECMHLRKQIEEMLKAGKLSHLIKELKQNNGKEQPKDEGTEGPMIIEAEIRGHCIHHMYVDGGSASEILYEHWQIQLLVTIGDGEHSASAWMNFVVVRSPSPYNGIIGRPGVSKLHAVPSTAHGMLKIPVKGGVITLKSSGLVPLECVMVSGPEGTLPARDKVDAVLSLPSPKCLKYVQKLNGKLASLNRALRGPELNYTSMEKLVLALVHASKRLKRPRVSVKGHILADFIVERSEEDSPDTPMEVEEELPEPWILFDATNNEAEYEALIAGLRIEEEMGVKNLQANVDSLLVANQVNRTYVVKEADMIRYLEKVKALTSSFKAFTIKQIPRGKNKKADALSKIASTSFAHLSKQVLVEELKEKSINEVEVLAVVEEEGDTWMTPIFKYLTEETLPTDMKKARAIRRKSWRFAGTRSVVAKALRTGYYWPTMHKDPRTLIRACQDYQVYKPIPRNLQQKLTPITSPWPFYKWGIDIAGPFPEGPGKVKFLIVAMDYFIKWIKAKPVATIIGNQIKKLVWDNIVCRFRLPREIISDNGKLFRDDPFKDWCEKLCIHQHFASVKHPQTNELIERANRILGEGIKARLDARGKNWMKELPHVLWAHRTMIKSSNGDTLFSLTCGTKAVIPSEIRMPTLRTVEVDLVHNNEALEINLDLLEERREEAAIREAKSKAKIEKYYNAKV